MTVSLSKGKKLESNFKHNERKTQLNGKSQEVIDSFYETENHKHIKRDLTRLNVDKPHESFEEVYDRLFGKAIEEYNAKQKRKDRKIGKGKAIPGELKKNKIFEIRVMLKYLSVSEAERNKFLTGLSDQNRVLFKKTFLEKYKGKTEKDLKKDLAFWKSQESYGEAYYKQIKNDKKSKTHTEFIAQLGNAEDFNEVKNGQIVKSYDREDPSGIWQKSKNVLKAYMDGFQKRNPNLFLVGYSIHMDESSPHVQFDVVPVAEQSKTQSRGKKKIGLSQKVSFNGALESQGFKGNPKKYFTDWQHQEADVLAALMEKELGEKRKSGKTNNIENIHEYKKLKVLESEKLEKLEKLNEQQKNKENVITSLESQLQDLNKQLSKGTEKLQEVLDWSSSKTQELNDREKEISSRELKIADREKKLTAKENTLSQSQDVLERQKRVFNEKVKKNGDLDNQIAKKQKKLDKMDEFLSTYSSNFDKKKKQILDKKQKELDKEKTEQLAEFKRKVDQDKLAYLDDVTRQYRKTLKQREYDDEQREKQFIDKVKNFANSFRLVYISEGLKSTCGTNREVQYQAQKYLQLSRDQQKARENEVFSGPGGFYRRLSAFKEAVDYLFHGNGTESSLLQSLEGLAREAQEHAEYYNNLKNGHVRNGNDPSRSKSGPEL